VERAQEALGFGNLEVEVEYQSDTIGRYGLDFEQGRFLLTTKQTDCLARTSAASPNQSITQLPLHLPHAARPVQDVVSLGLLPLISTLRGPSSKPKLPSFPQPT